MIPPPIASWNLPPGRSPTFTVSDDWARKAVMRITELCDSCHKRGTRFLTKKRENLTPPMLLELNSAVKPDEQ